MYPFNVSKVQDFFTLFSLSPQFKLDLNALESQFRAMQSASHPDRFVTASDAEKLAAMQTATTVNQAYQTLKNPAQRAAYLLAQQGVDVEADRSLPIEFLAQQMEWRESIEDNANNLSALHHLQREIKTESAGLIALLGAELDEQQAWQLAAVSVRKLQFMHKLRDEINRKIETLED